MSNENVLIKDWLVLSWDNDVIGFFKQTNIFDIIPVLDEGYEEYLFYDVNKIEFTPSYSKTKNYKLNIVTSDNLPKEFIDEANKKSTLKIKNQYSNYCNIVIDDIAEIAKSKLSKQELTALTNYIKNNKNVNI